MKKIVLILMVLFSASNVFAQTERNRVKVLRMPNQEVEEQQSKESLVIEKSPIIKQTSSPAALPTYTPIDKIMPPATHRQFVEPTIISEPKETVTETKTFAEKTTEVTININGIKNDNGKIMVLMFNRADAFPDNYKRAAENYVDAKTGAIAVKYTKVPKGNYAVVAYHDENENRELDKSFFNFFIKEGLGFSNNLKANFFGKMPSFDEASFVLGDNESEKTIEINLAY